MPGLLRREDKARAAGRYRNESLAACAVISSLVSACATVAATTITAAAANSKDRRCGMRIAVT